MALATSETQSGTEQNLVRTAMTEWEAKLNNQIVFKKVTSNPDLVLGKVSGTGLASPGAALTAFGAPSCSASAASASRPLATSSVTC